MEYLTKLEREIIKIGKSKEIFSFKDLQQLQPKYKEDDIYLCCKSLADRGYFHYKTFADGGIPIALSLSNQARSLDERNRLETLDFFKKSVLCPIFVSILTTLIVLWLQSLIS